MNVRSPSGWIPTKVKGVVSAAETQIPDVSTPNFSSSSRMNRPLRSSPTLEKDRTARPMRASAEGVLAAPPPGMTRIHSVVT